MNQVIAALLLLGAAEWLVTYLPIYRLRKFIASGFFIFCGALSVWLAINEGNRLWLTIVCYFSLFRLFNLYRLARSRINPKHLIRVSRNTAWRLLVAQLIMVGIGAALTNVFSIHQLRWIALASVDVVLAVILGLSTLRHRRVARRIHLKTQLIDSNIPTLTVAIPARDETDNLNSCLLSLVACDYPKLEIIVLDDQSTTRRTPEIIRSFAHDGVRFLPGAPVEEGWLAKNWAYQQLLEEANGEVVLFCGADTRFEPQALRFLVSSLEVRGKSVISILPKNEVPYGVWQRFLQPLRYGWEVSLPRRSFQRPPVLSTCWLAKKSYLDSSGGFKAVSRRVVCESYFARTAAIHDGYSFFQYDGVTSQKPAEDQLETAVRLRYPQLHRQPEFVALLSLLEFAGIVGPVLLLISALAVSSWVLAAIAGVSVLINCASFALVVNLTYRKNVWSVFASWPLACLIDIVVMYVSMWRYEFGQVLWKGRSVAGPVIHAD